MTRNGSRKLLAGVLTARSAGQKIKIAVSLATLLLVLVLISLSVRSCRKNLSVSVSLAVGRQFRGKGMWIWFLQNAEGGDVKQMVKRAKGTRLTFVLIKVNDGREIINPKGKSVYDPRGEMQLNRGIVEEFHAAGIAVFAW